MTSTPISVFFLTTFSFAINSCSDPDSGQRSNEPLSQAQQAIWNGTDYQGPMPEAEAAVYVVVGTTPDNVHETGSGVALNNRWVLTAGHVIGNRGSAISPGNVRVKQFTDPGTEHAAETGSVVHNGPWVPWGLQDRIYDLEIIKLQTRLPIGGTTTDYKAKIFGQGHSNITSDIVGLQVVKCWGWGKGGNSGGPGSLRFTDLGVKDNTITDFYVPPDLNPITVKAPVNFFTTKNGDTQIAEGDSGGPCYAQTDGSLVGIIRARVLGAPGQPVPSDPVDEAVITSVGAYNNPVSGDLDDQLRAIADHDPERVAFSNLDGDDHPDLLMAINNNGYLEFQGQFTNVALNDGFFDFPTILPTQIAASAIDTMSQVIGDFNGDGVGDILAFAGGNALYFDGAAGAFPTVHLDISPNCFSNPVNCLTFVSHDYKELRTTDLDGDTYDDVEAFQEGSSVPDIYYGSPYGLTNPAFQTTGFPTSDGNDGKFFTLTVNPSASIGVPDYTFGIESYHLTDEPASSRMLHIEVFDGDFSGSHDTTIAGVQVHTCFELYLDPTHAGSATTPWFTQSSDTHFQNNAWTSLFNEPQHEVLAAENHGAEASYPGYSIHDYVLRVFLTTGSCDDPEPSYPVDAVANSMKIRANGDVHFWSSVDPVNGFGGAVSIIGSDAAGDHAAVPPVSIGGVIQDVDTSYDGSWSFEVQMELGSYSLPVPTSFWLSEADADSTLDACSPAQAVGQNAEIEFSVHATDAEGNILQTFLPNTDPSGQYEPAPGEQCITYPVSMPQSYPWVFWSWSNVLTHNNIWIAAPTSVQPTACKTSPDWCTDPAPVPAPSPTMAAVLRLYGEKPRFQAPTTSASPLSSWLSAPGKDEIASLLPIVLGEHGRGHGVHIHSPRQALEILRRGTRALPGSPLPERVGKLKAELLVAKLNLARGNTHDENIGSSYIYATTYGVADVIAQADQALAGACNGKHCTTHAEMTRLTDLLRNINASNITYRAPIPVTTTTMSSSNAPLLLRSATPGTDGYWREH